MDPDELVIAEMELQDFADEVYDQELDDGFGPWDVRTDEELVRDLAAGFSAAGDRGWHPDTAFSASAGLCLLAGGIISCAALAGVIEAVRLVAAAIRVVTG